MNYWDLYWQPLLQVVWYGGLLLLVAWMVHKIFDYFLAGIGERRKSPWRW